MMANLGMADTLILMVLALVVFGPRRLPQIGKQIGKLMYEFRKASNDFKFQMEEELRQSEEADRRKKEEDERQRALAAAPPPAQLESSTAPSAESPIATPYPEAPGATENAQANGTSTSDFISQDGAAARLAEPEPAAAALPEAAVPRIQPPSTGETVAAERPGTQPEQRELFSGDSGKTAEPAAPEAERSEPAAHHAAHNG